MIDFGIATIFDLKQPYVSNPELIEATLAYCSPEQTGRMNCAVDFRADLYAMGATFYEVLAGALPFQAGSAISGNGSWTGTNPHLGPDGAPSWRCWRCATSAMPRRCC